MIRSPPNLILRLLPTFVLQCVLCSLAQHIGLLRPKGGRGGGGTPAQNLMGHGQGAWAGRQGQGERAEDLSMVKPLTPR